MEITGKIIHALEPRSGVSASTGNPWSMQTFVIETTQEQYPRRCAFEVFGEERLKQFNFQVGQEYTVSFDIDAREYQGRWYNSVRAWRVAAPQAIGAPVPPPGYGAPAPAPQQAGFTQPAGGSGDFSQAPTGGSQSPTPQPNSGDDLPF